VPKFLRRKPRTVRDVLEALDLSEEEIVEAEAAGTDELLAIDAIVLPERGKLTIDDLAQKAGTEVEVVHAFWRALGFVEPAEGELAFTRRDVGIVKSLVELTEDGVVDPELGLQVARVLGVSMAQVAAAVVDAAEARSDGFRDSVGGSDHSDDGLDDVGDGGRADAHVSPAERDAGSFPVRAGELMPFLADVVDYALRRHLRAAARRRVAVTSSSDDAGQVVAFADLVRFTELSRQLDHHRLARLIGRFDQLVHETVVRHGGRIVKMIGDAAMFTLVAPEQAALVALELADTVAGDDLLPGVRVGMAAGPVLARDGDLYGPVVNTASRLVTIGRAGAVNVTQEVRDAVAGDVRFDLRSLGSRNLRHIGEVRVYRLRRGPAWVPATITDGRTTEPESLQLE
jgi:adenylate cyclase